MDQTVESLVDDKAISAARKVAENQYRNFTSDEIGYMRRRAKTDLFYLSTLLEYDKLTVDLHGDFCNWYEGTKGKSFKLELWPRGHYKSTLITISDSVQIALPNIANVQTFPHCLGPSVKLLIAHEVRETAADFLFEITKAFTRKPALLALFPESIPNKREQRANKWELDIPGRVDHKEATFNTVGAGGASQGGHFNWIKLDDLIGEAARDSPTVMKGTIQWFDNIISLLTDETDGFDLTGTRWAYNDVYSHAMETYGIDLSSSVVNCLSDKDIKMYGKGLLQTYARGVIEKGKPIFPKIMTPERIRILRKNPIIWAAQYVNNPQESGMTEFPWKLKFYNVTANEKIVVFNGIEEAFSRHKHELDICVFCDPSMGQNELADESGIVVTGVDSKSNIFIMETIKKRLKPPQLIDELFRLFFKYRPRVVAIEEVNFSAIYRYWINEKATENKVNLPIKPYKPGSVKSKEARIRGLSHFFSAGQVYIHEGMHDFRDEYEQFPMGKSQHLLDALAQGPVFWTKGNSQSDIDHYQKAVNDNIRDERDLDTGY